jgi:hypothetical protein
MLIHPSAPEIVFRVISPTRPQKGLEPLCKAIDFSLEMLGVYLQVDISRILTVTDGTGNLCCGSDTVILCLVF